MVAIKDRQISLGRQSNSSGSDLARERFEEIKAQREHEKEVNAEKKFMQNVERTLSKISLSDLRKSYSARPNQVGMSAFKINHTHGNGTKSYQIEIAFSVERSKPEIKVYRSEIANNNREEIFPAITSNLYKIQHFLNTEYNAARIQTRELKEKISAGQGIDGAELISRGNITMESSKKGYDLNLRLPIEVQAPDTVSSLNLEMNIKVVTDTNYKPIRFSVYAISGDPVKHRRLVYGNAGNSPRVFTDFSDRKVIEKLQHILKSKAK